MTILKVILDEDILDKLTSLDYSILRRTIVGHYALIDTIYEECWCWEAKSYLNYKVYTKQELFDILGD